MRISAMNIEEAIEKQQRVRIVKAPREFKAFEGKTGTLTSPFGHYVKGQVGLFLDVPVNDRDELNIDGRFEVETVTEVF